MPREKPSGARTAKLFTDGRSRAVRLPAAYRFEETEVFIRRDPISGDVILSRKPASWDGFFAALERAEPIPDFLGEADRNEGTHDRDPFAGWSE